MAKKKIDALDYAKEILTALPKGILLNTKAEDKVNSMVIGWGSIGIEWGRPIFTAYVREGRHTMSLIEKNPEFTISVPLEGAFDANIIKACSAKSGRDIDKIKEAGLTLEEPEVISVPGLREFALTLECKLVLASKQELSAMDASLMKWYPQDVPSESTGSNKDTHIALYGEIVSAYIIE
jgi:flavin reductase (DIM6/NTAB) family NADH-FMN oxidoreductase RutF